MKQKRTTNIISNIVAILLAVAMLFPILWIIVCSFKPNREMFQKPLSFLPKEPTVEAYTVELIKNHVVQGYLNSFLVAMGALIIGLVLGVTAAYGLARFRMKGKKLALILFLVTQMLPASLMLTPMYLTYSKLGILNSYIAPIISIATVSIPFCVVTLRPFFLNLPKGLDDAARVDGCNALTSFLRVMLPIAKPGVITAAALSFIFGWNDLAFNMTFNTKEVFRPLTSILYNLMPMEGIRWSAVMALGTATVMPIMVLFVAFQKFIIGGLTAGAVKE